MALWPVASFPLYSSQEKHYLDDQLPLPTSEAYPVPQQTMIKLLGRNQAHS